MLLPHYAQQSVGAARHAGQRRLPLSSPRRGLLAQFALATMAIHMAGCVPPGEPSVDEPTPPQACANSDFNGNFTFSIDLCFYGTIYRNQDLEALGAELAAGGLNPVPVEFPGIAVRQTPVGADTDLLIALDPPVLDPPPDPTSCPVDQAWMVIRHQIPLGYTIPLGDGDAVLVTLLMRIVDPAAQVIEMARAVLLNEWDAQTATAGRPVFYGEPGLHGLAFGPQYPSGLFLDVHQSSANCPPIRSDNCGDLVNTAIKFRPENGADFLVWPGETHDFVLDTARLTAINIWSYQWMNLACAGSAFSPQMAFVIVASD